MRLGPKVFADPFVAAAESPAAEASTWPNALQGLKGAVDGWSFAPSDLGQYLTVRAPEVAQLVITNAAATLAQVTKRIQRNGVAKGSLPAIQQAQKALDQALAPQNLGHATEVEAGMIEMAMRALMKAVAPHTSKSAPAEALAERLHQTLAANAGDTKPEDVVLATSGSALFTVPPKSESAPLRVLYEGALTEAQIVGLVELAADRPIQLADLEEESVRHLWRGPDDKIRCDDPALVAANAALMTLGHEGNIDTLPGLVESARSHGLSAVHLRLETTEPAELFDAALVALDALSGQAPSTTVTIRDADGRPVLSAKPASGGWKLGLPAVPRTRDAEVAGILRRSLEDGRIQELTFGGVGFSREGDGVHLRLPNGVELRQVTRTVAPIFAYQLGQALDLKEGSETGAVLRPFFRDAIDHLNHTSDTDIGSFRDPREWQRALDGIRTFVKDPARKDALGTLLKTVVRRSESPGNDGFGNAAFTGHARSRNAFDLVRAFSSAASDDAIAQYLERAQELFDAPIRGAVLGIVYDMVLGDDRGRSDSARTEESRLRSLSGMANQVSKPGSEVMVAVLPTDRTHGRARTPTPDFYVRRSEKGALKELFVDAKARAAIGVLKKENTGVAEAAHQVFAHRFGEGPSDGMVMLSIYGGDVADREELLRLVQRDVDVAALNAKAPLWVQVQLRHQNAATETVMLHSAGQPALPPALQPD